MDGYRDRFRVIVRACSDDDDDDYGSSPPPYLDEFEYIDWQITH